MMGLPHGGVPDSHLDYASGCPIRPADCRVYAAMQHGCQLRCGPDQRPVTVSAHRRRLSRLKSLRGHGRAAVSG